MNQKQLLKINELSKVLKVSESWIRIQINKKGKNKMPCLRHGKKLLRFDLDRVLAWMKKQQ